MLMPDHDPAARQLRSRDVERLSPLLRHRQQLQPYFLRFAISAGAVQQRSFGDATEQLPVDVALHA
jgi:hypothetical protein